MEPICIPGNSAVYKAGALMIIGGGIPLADAIFLINLGAMHTGFALPIIFMFVMGCYGILAGICDLVKWQRAKTTPALLLTDEGITDTTGILTGGLLRWSEVRSVSQIRVQGQQSLAIQLVDNATYLARLPAWKRFLLASNIALSGTPFLISETELAVTLDQAKTAIENAHHPAIKSAAQEAPPQPVAHWWTAIPPEERVVLPLRNQR